MTMTEYDIIGMNCSACSSKIQKSVSGISGVTNCNVNLLTNSMTVEGEVNPDTVILAVKRLGYRINVKGQTQKDDKNSIEKNQINKIKKRLFISLGFLAVLTYIAMGVVMWDFPLPDFLIAHPLIIGIIELALSLTVMVINNKFFINGVKGIIHFAPNMDTLVSLGSFASFVFSAVYLFSNANITTFDILKNLYFDSAAMILVLVTVGKLLEAYSKGKTTSALNTLKKLSPLSATVLRDGAEILLPISEVNIGDTVVVKAGENIPVDGIIIDGSSSINEASLTGESLPIDKKKKDEVYASTINLNGILYIKTNKVGKETAISKIVDMVEKASTSKAPVAKIADAVSGIFVPIVLLLGVIASIIWLSLGFPLGFSLARGISVLVVSCPCALGLATPVAIMVANGVGAKHNVLFKSAEILENTGKIKILAIDKTGTITKGEMSVTDIIPTEYFTEKELLTFAYSLENNSSHPIAKAIVKKAIERSLTLESTSNFNEIAGQGISADINQVTVFAGKLDFISQKISIPNDIREKINILNGEGKTSLLIATDDDLIGIIALADVIKEDSSLAIAELKKMGITPIMLTGDNQKTAEHIAKRVGIDRVYANLLPDQKGKIIHQLKKEGKVGMVGDGINDALALTLSDVGIAIGAGTDVAIDSASVVLMNSSLGDAVNSIRLSKKTLSIIKQNLFWAFFYNVIGIPLAGGAFIPLFGWQLSPMFSSLCMSISSLLVVTNALRLNLINIKSNKTSNKKTKKITTDVAVSGMMCHHCEKSVVDALSKISGVVSVSANYIQGVVSVTYLDSLSLFLITSCIENLGYHTKIKSE